MAGAVRVEGLRALDRALAELPKRTGKSVLRRALLNAAAPLVEAASQRAPRFRGDLEDSIDASTKLSPRQRRMHRTPPVKTIDGFRSEPSKGVEVFVGAGPTPQAHLQEFGTEHHRAQPFLRPAWDATKRRVLDNVRGELASEMAKAVKRIAARAEREAARLKSG